LDAAEPRRRIRLTAVRAGVQNAETAERIATAVSLWGCDEVYGMHPNKASRAVCFAGTLTVALLVCSAASSQPTIAPNGPPWKVKPAFEKSDKVREAISGAACALTLPPTCLAINDETAYAQFFSIKGRKILPHRLIRLVPDGAEPGELDIEGAAYDRGFFYVVGSHGAPRNPAAAIDPSRFFMFRFRVNERTGKPRFRFGDEFVDTTAIVRTNALREVIRHSAEIGPFAEKPLGENGANIEGLTVRDDRIYLGFRGPSVDGRAFILAVNANGVFGNEAMKEKIHPIRLGNATGIRDLAGLRKAPGMLVLAGPVGETGVYSVHYWDGQSDETKPLAILGGVPPGGKPETLLVLSESSARYFRVLVLIEGIANGNPLEYLIPR
jgi:hypothetical protein